MSEPKQFSGHFSRSVVGVGPQSVPASLPEAVDRLLKADTSFEFPVSWGLDLQSEHERYLTEKVFRKPVIVTDYPKEIKAFYMRLNDDGKTVAAMDVLEAHGWTNVKVMEGGVMAWPFSQEKGKQKRWKQTP